MKSDLLISIVVPVHNAEAYAAERLGALAALLAAHYADYEIVVADNASSDGTAAAIEGLAERIANLQYFRLLRRVPEDTAYAIGVEEAIGDYVVTMDLEYDPPEIIPQLTEIAQRGHEIVYGAPLRDPMKRGLRRFLSQRYYRVFQQLSGHALPAHSSRFRLLSRRAVNSFLDNPDRFVLFSVAPALSGLPYTTLDYQRHDTPRAGRAPRESLFDNAGRAFRTLFLASDRPLRGLTLLSLVGAFLNLGYSVYVLAVAFFKARVAEGWASLSLQVTAMFFLLFLILAVISEYLSRLMLLNQARPPYLIGHESRSRVMRRAQRPNVHEARGAAKDEHNV